MTDVGRLIRGTIKDSRRRKFAEGGDAGAGAAEFNDRFVDLPPHPEAARIQADLAARHYFGDSQRKVVPAGYAASLPDAGSPLIPGGQTQLSPGTAVGNKLFGSGDPDRLQLWPEKMVRSGFTLPHDVGTGEVPMNVMDQATGEMVLNPDVIQRAQDMAGMAGGQTLLAGARGAGAATAGPNFRIMGRPVLAADSQAVGAPLAALEHAPKFYSHMDTVVDTAPMQKGTGAQWLGTLTNRGVKPDELQWTGTKTFLEQNADQVLTKEQVKEHTGANKMELGEVTKGYAEDVTKSPKWQRLMAANEALTREYDRAYTAQPRDLDRIENINSEMNANHDAMREMEEGSAGADTTKYHAYQLPGGENYREKLLTMPTPNDRYIAATDAMRAKYGDMPLGKMPMTEAERAFIDKQIDAYGDTGGTYKSSHWDEPNILVHRRTNERDVHGAPTTEQAAAIEARKAIEPQIEANRNEQRELFKEINATVKPLEEARKAKIMADFKTGIAEGKRNFNETQRALEQVVDFPEIKPLQDRLQQLRAQEDSLRKSMPEEPQTAKRSLHLEEIQSDWHQAGRKQGYKGDVDAAALERKANVGYQNLVAEIRKNQPNISKQGADGLAMDLLERIKQGEGRGSFFTKEEHALGQQWHDDMEAYLKAGTKMSMVPNAPFRKNWHELALKDALREAAEQGHDRISWTPGAAQAKRYDLSQHVRDIVVVPHVDGGGRTWWPTDTNGKGMGSILTDKNGVVTKAHATYGDIVGKSIDDVIGKDVAAKGHAATTETKLSGADLSVGGEGMKGFYDKMVPDYLNKIGKPHGVKVEKGELPDARSTAQFQAFESRNGRHLRDFADSDEAHRWLQQNGYPDGRVKINTVKSAEPVHYMDIPQSLKDHVLKKGFSLFEDSATAAAPLTALERAAQQGFDTSKKWYHSALQPVEQFDKYGKFMGRSGTTGIHLTDNPEMASRYLDRYGDYDYKGQPFQKNIIPVYVNPGKTLERQAPFTSDVPMGHPIPEGYQSPVEKMGYDSLLRSDAINRRGQVKHVDPEARGAVKGNEMVLTDPSRVRSIHAQFDPEHVGKSGLLLEDSATAAAPLTALERSTTRNPNFKKWFEGSKAVGGNGQPQRFYHGTTSDFDTFGRIDGGNQYGAGYYFTKSPESASAYATGDVNRITPEGNAHPNVMPVYLNYAKPYDRRGPVAPADLRKLEAAANEMEPGHWKNGELARQFDRAYPPNGDNVAYQLGPKADQIIRKAGYDAMIAPDMTVVFEPTQIKSASGNSGGFNSKKPSALFEDSAAAGAPLTALEQGYTGPWYHGGERMDRFTEKGKIDPKRATSGPMPYFTDDPQVASNYAKGKPDTSRFDEGNVADYFQVTPKQLGISGRAPLTVERSWHFLPRETKQDILAKATRVGHENINMAEGPYVLHPEGVNATGASVDHWKHIMAREAGGNPLAALRDLWHDSGRLVDNPSDLTEIFRLAGYPHQISEANAPWTEAKGVFPGMLRMRKPLQTDDAKLMTETVLPALEQAFKRDRTRTKEYGADMWDKNTRYTPREWVHQAKEDYAKGDNSFVWTSIPDKVTAELRKLGFDGVVDTGGKMGGQGHKVAIPFGPEQVRSTFAKFDPKKIGENGLLLQDAATVAAPLSASEHEDKAMSYPSILQRFAEGGDVEPDAAAAPVFDPTRLAALHSNAPVFDPAKLAAAKPKSMSAGDVLSGVVENAPSSAWQFAKDVVRPVTHPVETLGGIKDLGLGLLEKSGLVGTGKQDPWYAVLPPTGGGHEQYADAMGEYLKNRYGGWENIKKSVAQDPVGVLSDASMVLTGGGSGAARAPGIIGKAGEVAGNIGRAVDPLMAPVNAARVGTKAVGELLTHTGGTPLQNAYKAGVEGGEAGDIFRGHMRGTSDSVEPVEMAKRGLAGYRAERGKNYREGMGDITSIDRQMDPLDRVLDFGKINKAVDETQRYHKFGVMDTNKPAAAIRDEMMGEIAQWQAAPPATYHTLEGLDALKKSLGGMMMNQTPGTPARAAASEIYNAVKKTIVEYDPKYAQVMKDYELASTQIRELERAMSLGEKASADTALRKLQSIMRNNVNTNYGRRLELGKLLEENGAKHLMAALSGQSLNAWFPRGLGKIGAELAVLGGLSGAGHAGAGALGGLGAVAALPLMSPRLMGEVAHGAGRTVGRGLNMSNRALGNVGLNNRTLGNASYRLGRTTNPYENAPDNPYAP